MIKPIKLALLFIIAGALLFDPVAIALGTDKNPPATAGGTDPGPRLSLDPVASTTPRRLPARGSRSALATDNDPPADAGGSDLTPAAQAIAEEETTSNAHTDADFAAHIEQLKKKLPSDDFTIVVQKPFVVIGDEPADNVKAHSIRTVKWAVDKLKKEYFSKDPNEIIDIWLFKDAASYERNAQLLFGYKPDTPFGYYSKTHKALVMNISTGGGTVVHEIVHPFVEANFPNCPPWFNEGLGSLYEQSGEVRGRIHGFTNWRLPRLQADIKAGRVPPFRKLMGMSVPEFYNFESGSHYAQARYLLYYLQQKGLLTKFYREFYAHQKTDPTGYQTLARVLGTRNLEIFKFKWELWVMDLTQGHEVQ